jgi:hypothetical protein
MHSIVFFRRKLAHRLRQCAARRHAVCAGDPAGDDLVAITLLERLAREAEILPQALTDEVAHRCADPAYARRFEQVWDVLAEVLGAPVMPCSAVALVRWMLNEARHDPGAKPWDGAVTSRLPGATEDLPEGDNGRPDRRLASVRGTPRALHASVT